MYKPTIVNLYSDLEIVLEYEDGQLGVFNREQIAGYFLQPRDT